MPKLASPLDHPKLIVVSAEPPHASVATTPAPAVAAQPAQPAADPLAGLSLTATLRTREGAGMAAINGKIYRVGDEVRPGCKLSSVDTNKNRADFTLADGSTASLGRKE
jgi:hypothetical protein